MCMFPNSQCPRRRTGTTAVRAIGVKYMPGITGNWGDVFVPDECVICVSDTPRYVIHLHCRKERKPYRDEAQMTIIGSCQTPA